MAAQIDIERAEERRTRVELTLGRIAQGWQHQVRGPAFTQALLDLLRSIHNQSTLRSYCFSILELWGWHEQKERRFITPDRLTRADAMEYATWLRDRERGLEGWRLSNDPQHLIDRAIFEVVDKEPGIDIEGIRRRLRARHSMTTIYRGELILRADHPEEGKPGGLGYHLACMVKRRMIQRTPTVEELRRQAGMIYRPDDREFSYYPPSVATKAGASRASTIVTRLSALSTLWRYMMKGENAPGREQPLIQHNIWLDPLRVYQAQAPSHRAATRAAKTPGRSLIMRLLEGTFYRTHGSEQAVEAARSVMWGGVIPPGSPDILPAFKDLRDRLLILVMVQLGVRAEELGSLRRGDLSGSPSVISIIGKGGKRRVLQVPPAVLRALDDLTAKLGGMAEHQRRNDRGSRAADLLANSSPLVPAIAYWGANSATPEKGLSRPAIARVLQRRAESIGIAPGSEEMARIHPHGLRHLFAHIAADSGTPMNRIQAMLGHASMGTTSVYVEERAPDKLIAEAFRGPVSAAAPAAPVIAPAVSPRSVREAPPWRPERQPISPPAPPMPPPRERIERIVEREERPALGEAPSRAVRRVAPEEEIETIERARGKPLTTEEHRKVQQCRSIRDTSLRKLCEIYQLHWGEKGDRQRLVKPETAAGPPRRAERKEILVETPRYLPNETRGERRERFKREEEQRIAQRSAVIRGETEIEVQSDARMFANVFSGKSSGLSWWTGSSGSMEPEMPVISSSQIGSCDEERQDELCGLLIKLWRRWYRETPDKAAALVLWVADALELSAQVERIVLERDGCWVTSGASWERTRVRGSRGSPDPRQVFREHIPGQIAAWFEAVAWQHRVSPGSPVGDKRRRSQKVLDERPPRWYESEDPIRDLSAYDRAELLDWLLALTGGMPESQDRRYIATWINDLCLMDEVLSEMKEDPYLGPSFVSRLIRDNSSYQELERKGQSYVANLLASTGGKDMSQAEQRRRGAEVLRMISEAQMAAQYSFRDAISSFTSSLDTFGMVHHRVTSRDDLEGGRTRLSSWYLGLVKEHIGAEVANDPVIKLVARCGSTPLATDEMRELLNVQSGTIRHSDDYIRRFALAYGSHSECVARRIARELWEIRKANPQSQYVTEPRYIMTLILSMRAFKVPCSKGQERKLREILGDREPAGIFGVWRKAQEDPYLAEEQRCPISEELEEEMGELQEMFIPNARGAPALPNPIQLMAAFQSLS
jgi:integrase